MSIVYWDARSFNIHNWHHFYSSILSFFRVFSSKIKNVLATADLFLIEIKIDKKTIHSSNQIFYSAICEKLISKYPIYKSTTFCRVKWKKKNQQQQQNKQLDMKRAHTLEFIAMFEYKFFLGKVLKIQFYAVIEIKRVR